MGFNFNPYNIFSEISIGNRFIQSLYRCIFVVIALIICQACENDEPSTPEVLPVIEGSFDSDGYPIVKFTKSISPEIEGSIKDNVINWGKITIFDGEKNVILTGRVDKKYTPSYIYYTRDMQGVPGKSYHLTAEFDRLYAEAESMMPSPTDIDHIELKPTENDSLKSATLYFVSPEDTPAYYYLTMSNISENGVAYPCLMGTLQADKPGTEYAIPIMCPKIKIDNAKYVPHLKAGVEYKIFLNRVTKEVYDFWKAYDNMVMFSSSPFISSNQSLPGNVVGGYGVWSPQGTSSRFIMFDIE